MKNQADYILKSKQRTLKRVLAELERMQKVTKNNPAISSADFDYQTRLYSMRNFINAQGITPYEG